MQSKGQAVLFSEMAPAAAWTDRFHNWYDTHHIPVRMACPGFVSAQRYRRQDGEGYLAVYEMDDVGVLSSDAYKVIKSNPSEDTAFMLANVSGFTRYLASETSAKPAAPGVAAALDAPILYSVCFNVPAEAAAEFDSWYETEHIPLLMECPDWLMVRRMLVTDGVPEIYTHMALHYLADAKALQSPARENARATEWRKRLAEQDWFQASYAVFDRWGQRQLGQR
ncbi:hypothetical protein HNR60_003084 [Rhodopseudomonas rhenobacensis]|uniref:EthD domain-containing protein n=1 Tax=Rhodopseudomonas rhenobacensis TaxID=87461 RepID=A0A7W8E0X0_9BRAD|nr:DUF4286 family protein [Rhodopseudomonas rhenobacensis]MBB5048321.1 hypothetical protein [Rhodopseudomonas rhenobacensis]